MKKKKLKLLLKRLYRNLNLQFYTNNIPVKQWNKTF